MAWVAENESQGSLFSIESIERELPGADQIEVAAGIIEGDHNPTEAQ
ncbi:MAG: hypothetical protein GY938_13075 [Ketobacter sp.]|nr:hypothetical protein [Ketobacter sp.]